MVKCSRCGTENTPGARFCVSCGLDLAGIAESPRVATLEDAPVRVPEWVFPAPVTEVPKPEKPRVSAARPVKFVALTLAFLGVFAALPVWAIWSTSPLLRQAGVSNYFKRLPSCAESARATGQDPSLCNDPSVRTRFSLGTQQVKTERNRVLALAGVAYAALIMATLLLVLASGLRVWWTFGVLISPLNLVVWLWALWRVAALPARPWEPRS